VSCIDCSTVQTIQAPDQAKVAARGGFCALSSSRYSHNDCNDINVHADMSNQTLTIRTESESVETINAIAKAMDRSRNWVIDDALKQYIEQAWYIEGIQQAQASLASKNGIPYGEVMAEISELIGERIKAQESNK